MLVITSTHVMEGAIIGQYRVVRMLGEGGMGTVWLAEHTLLGRKAAIKVLLPEYTTNESIVQRFFNEARAVTTIADPGIVQVFDFGNANGSAYIVMELLEGEAMDTRLRRIRCFAPADTIRLMVQVAASLGAAHAKGIIHRDLKPENIYIVGDPAVTGGERTKILDFGIAKLAGDENSKHKTRTGMVMGTPVYMSPEQCRGSATIDTRSDIYALGCLLFTMLVGRPPFDSESSGDLIIMHVRDAPPVPSHVMPGIIPELDAVILRCLEKDPNRRYQTTQELVHALAGAEAALFGVPHQAMPHQQSGANPAYRPHLTPAAAMAYRQQNTPVPLAPDARTRIATPTGGTPSLSPHPTTLSSATGAMGANGTMSGAPSKGRGLIIAGVAVGFIVLGVVGLAVFGGGDKAKEGGAEPAAAAAPAPTPAPPQAPTPPPVEKAAATPPAPPPETPPATPTEPPATATAETGSAGSATTPAAAGSAAAPTTTATTTTAATTTASKSTTSSSTKSTKTRKTGKTGDKPGGTNARTSGTVDRGD